MATTPSLATWLPRASGLMLLVLAGCVAEPPTSSVGTPGLAANTARVWFYRDGISSEGLGAPFIRLNGGVVGVSRIGGAFYRDVPPGHYHVSADSYLADVNQTVDVDLAAGQQAYFKILPELVSCGSGREGGGCERQNFYVWIMPPEIARPTVMRSQFYAGGS